MTATLRPGPEISSLYAFGSTIYLFDKTCHFVPKPGTEHFVAVSCKRLQKLHADKSSYRSDFVPFSCKYPLRKYSSRLVAESQISSCFSNGRTDYCNSLLYGLPNSHIIKLQRIQNALSSIGHGNTKILSNYTTAFPPSLAPDQLPYIKSPRFYF